MPVRQVAEDISVRANARLRHSPEQVPEHQQGCLRLAPPLERRGIRMPVDFFFRSLAEDQQERAIGIILSGTGTDGTLRLKEIKDGRR
jgi:two-component system CheB/CheR fusion protein